MTQKEIQEAIDAIRQASKEARKSKESARQFLIDAGIIKDDKNRYTSGVAFQEHEHRVD